MPKNGVSWHDENIPIISKIEKNQIIGIFLPCRDFPISWDVIEKVWKFRISFDAVLNPFIK